MRNTIFNVGCGSLVVIALLGVLLASFNPSSTASSRRADAGLACTMAEKLIRPQLKAPKSAEFDYADCRASATHAGDTWTLRSYVDADNSYGAHIRSYYVARLTNVPPSDTWRLVELQFLD